MKRTVLKAVFVNVIVVIAIWSVFQEVYILLHFVDFTNIMRSAVAPQWCV